MVQDIFKAIESRGINDRELKDDIANQVIQKLEQKQANSFVTLPGMEDLVAKPIQNPNIAEIQVTIDSVLSQRQDESPKKTFEPLPVEAAKEVQPAPIQPETLEPEELPEVSVIKVGSTAETVLARRYLGKDRQGNVIETIEDMFRRVARNIASAEMKFNSDADAKAWEDEFYDVMTSFEFLPNSPTLMNAGRELQQLSACFVLPIEDSMESIFDAVKYTALIHKSGGGTGFSFSRLRPESDPVGSTGGVASGPVSFMRAFDTATDVIKQGGTRRGANMAILNVDHPDIEKFITAKEQSDALNNFNLSVALTERFMRAAERGSDYDLINPANKKVAGKANAKAVFEKIVDMAWRSGEPGIVFIDRINRDNPTPQLGAIESTNPCGEQPLLPYESCNLGSINLAKMVFNGRIMWDKLAKTVKTAVRFLDNVIEVNQYPLDKIDDMTRSTRKIGLGVMGFSDLLIMLGIPYDSPEAVTTAEEVMKFVDEEATQVSSDLASLRGVFPSFKGSVYDKAGGMELRNATRTTIAPTGTISIIAGCSSGIEPLFALCFTRTILDGDQFVEVHPLFEEAAKAGGFYSDELIKELASTGTLKDIEGVPEEIKKLFRTSHDITPEVHVQMQAAFQKYTNNAVSKTVNFPHDATREDVADVYMMAYRESCKGVTIYRDRSREDQVLALDVAKEEEVALVTEETRAPRDRPNYTIGVTDKVSTGCGSIYITVNSDEKGICEVFSHLGKAGGCAAAQIEAIGRLISLALRSGVEVPAIVKHLRGIRCPSIAWDAGHSILSCPDAIGGILEKRIAEKPEYDTRQAVLDLGSAAVATEHTKSNGNGSLSGGVAGACPDCGGTLANQEGCLTCHMCGYSKC
ncbi:MAG: vitamin B12-dependent ribonucleotide reductase [Chloroflexi bacterium]|nr:vitamin B12-dependent ribonucleotide reductase [Chloroflexota bacterium]MBT7080178.1 vitamin B12-dependent ribonucleotide reductase [Chloroflexota bacterium]MBT7289087.1 vitamin B12-dependent ribonucleotide reductase [Chloroflexota bacterium]